MDTKLGLNTSEIRHMRACGYVVAVRVVDPSDKLGLQVGTVFRVGEPWCPTGSGGVMFKEEQDGADAVTWRHPAELAPALRRFCVQVENIAESALHDIPDAIVRHSGIERTSDWAILVARGETPDPRAVLRARIVRGVGQEAWDSNPEMHLVLLKLRGEVDETSSPPADTLDTLLAEALGA